MFAQEPQVLQERIECLKEKLSRALPLSIELVVNENRSVMLNLLRKTSRYVRLSLHRMFLEAPDAVIQEIIRYIRSNGREKRYLIKEYIRDQLPLFASEQSLKRKTLVSRGDIYHLRDMYEVLNREYFQNQLNLHVTWYGKKDKKRGRSLIFGQYCSLGQLIKIHRLLDDAFVPEYFVSFVVYHEMLHAVIPGYFDDRGNCRMHGKEFKLRESLFKYYHQAKQWEKKHRNFFFKLRGRYGWA